MPVSRAQVYQRIPDATLYGEIGVSNSDNRGMVKAHAMQRRTSDSRERENYMQGLMREH